MFGTSSLPYYIHPHGYIDETHKNKIKFFSFYLLMFNLTEE